MPMSMGQRAEAEDPVAAPKGFKGFTSLPECRRGG